MEVESINQEFLACGEAMSRYLQVALMVFAGCQFLALSGCTYDEPGVEKTKRPPQGPSPYPEVVKTDELRFVHETLGETPDGEAVEQYTLINDFGYKVKMMTLGATLTAVETPDSFGKFDNIVLGFDNWEDYLTNTHYFGAICGRYANRIANGKFTLDGVEYPLVTNDDPNHLHGGPHGFHKVVWQATPITEGIADEEYIGVEMTYESPDGEEGYPGTLSVSVKYRLTNRKQPKFLIDYTATTDQATPVNLLNHTYWNLAGKKGHDILDLELKLNAEEYLVVDDTLIPTGESENVRRTSLDFWGQQVVGKRIMETKGYDHCYVVGQKRENVVSEVGGNELRHIAACRSPKSGRWIWVYSTKPAVQLYTANHLDGSEESGGYQKFGGLCLLPQDYPDAPNHPEFPNTILRPGETYRHTTEFEFLVGPHGRMPQSPH